VAVFEHGAQPLGGISRIKRHECSDRFKHGQEDVDTLRIETIGPPQFSLEAHITGTGYFEIP
jgi:hypothetical protein